MLSDMGMMINRRRVCGGGEKLPQGVVRIEYLENGGYQWIDTGIIPSDNFKVEADAVSPTNNIAVNNKLSLGAIYDSVLKERCYIPYVYEANIYSINYGKIDISGLKGFTFLLNTKYSLEIHYTTQRQIFRVNNVTLYDVSNNTTISIDTSFPLFKAKGFDEVYKIKLCSCKIYNSNILLRDFIPVRVGTVGYMYDKVSGQLFGNAGTGSFILGPDK